MAGYSGWEFVGSEGHEKMMVPSIRKKQMVKFLNLVFGADANTAKKRCRCKMCGLSVFISNVMVTSEGDIESLLSKTCCCEREFDPTEFTMCPLGTLHVFMEDSE
jgi:hypothetical protein